MSTTAVAEKNAPSSANSSGTSPQVATPRPSKSSSKTLLAGFDLGTNKSCVLSGAAGTSDLTLSKIVPSVVGYVKEGIVDGIIAGNASILFGEEALKNMLHANLVSPLAEGIISR